MAPLGIVEPEVASQSGAGSGHRLVGVQIHLLVFHAAPQPLDEHIIDPAPLPSMLMATSWALSTSVNAELVNWAP